MLVGSGFLEITKDNLKDYDYRELSQRQGIYRGQAPLPEEREKRKDMAMSNYVLRAKEVCKTSGVYALNKSEH